MFDGLCTLAIAPGNAFGDDVMDGASYSSHLVQKKDRNVPQRHELESARGLSGIVSRAFLTALRTDCLAVATGKNLGGDMLCLAAFFLETNGSETEGLVIRYRIEYSFEKHLG